MIVTIINKQNILGIDPGFLKKVSGYIADKFDNDDGTELNIIFVDRLEIRLLNKKYRKKDNETDVLSFTYGNDNNISSFDAEHGFSIVGEIVISPEIALENSKDVKRADYSFWNFKREIILLIIHGILHIYSYDHVKRDEKTKMENLQDSLIQDVFSKFNI